MVPACDAPAGNTGYIAAAGTTPHTENPRVASISVASISVASISVLTKYCTVRHNMVARNRHYQPTLIFPFSPTPKMMLLLYSFCLCLE